jgi:hypothetical protein
MSRFIVERGADGRQQYVLPGAEKAGDGTIAQRRADAPLRPTVAQEPPHTLGGLFGDEHKQIDLIDAIRKAK